MESWNSTDKNTAICSFKKEKHVQKASKEILGRFFSLMLLEETLVPSHLLFGASVIQEKIEREFDTIECSSTIFGVHLRFLALLRLSVSWRTLALLRAL